jgi:hypothetical protein
MQLTAVIHACICLYMRNLTFKKHGVLYNTEENIQIKKNEVSEQSKVLMQQGSYYMCTGHLLFLG